MGCTLLLKMYSKNPIRMDGVFNLAEQEGFEPSVPFWGTHDFQSCVHPNKSPRYNILCLTSSFLVIL